jgi:sporulation integral membrane protein YtvI
LTILSHRSTFLSWVYSLLILVGFLVAVWAVYTYALPFVVPFVIALILAEVMNPLISRLQRLPRVSRSLAVGLVLTIAVVILLVGITALTAELFADLQALIQQLPALYNTAVDLGNRYAEAFGTFHSSLPASVQALISSNMGKVQQALTAAATQLTGVVGLFTSLPNFMLNVVIAVVSTFYIARDRREIGDFLLRLFPREWRPQLRQVKQEVWTSTMGYAKAQLVVILIATIYSITALSILGVDYSVLVGILIGVADLLPLLGPGAIYLPWAAYAGFTGHLRFGIWLLVIWAIQMVIRQVIEPRIVGEQMGLHPLATLFAIYMGFQVFGAMGFVLGPIVAILLMAVIRSGLLPIFRDERPF